MTYLSPSINESFPNLKKGSDKSVIKALNKQRDRITHSHKIRGRWENKYLDLQYVPEVKDIFSIACQTVKELTDISVIIPYRGLGLPLDEFWFNIARPGESTGWHDHKANAIISGVYYFQVPERSGNIFFRKKMSSGRQEWSISSQTGKMVLFDANIEHSVEVNSSDQDRISLAFNIYTLPLKLNNRSDDYSTNKFFS